jgi:hypothetical protein
LIDQFRCGLRDDVQDLLLTFTDPSSFSEAINQAIQCDNYLFERRQEKKVTSNAQLWNSRPITLPLVPQTTPVAQPASFGPTPNADRRSQVKTFDRSRETSPKDKQPVSLLWQPRAHSSPVPSKACQTSSTSCGNSPRIGKQEHPVTVGAMRLDLTQHHLWKGSCSAVGPSPSFT